MTLTGTRAAIAEHAVAEKTLNFFFDRYFRRDAMMKSKLAVLLLAAMTLFAGVSFAAEPMGDTSSDAFWYRSTGGVPCCD